MSDLNKANKESNNADKIKKTKKKIGQHGLLYDLNLNENTAKVTGLEREQGSIIIPENIENKFGKFKVTSIDTRAFSLGNNEIRIIEITIPKSVIEIKDYVFSSNINLERVTLSEGLISIGKMAFGGCCNLKELSIPDTVTSIADDAFYYDTTLCGNSDHFLSFARVNKGRYRFEVNTINTDLRT